MKFFSVKREDEEKKLEVENDELRRSIMIQRQNIQLAVRQNEELEVKIRDLEEELERYITKFLREIRFYVKSILLENIKKQSFSHSKS